MSVTDLQSTLHSFKMHECFKFGWKQFWVKMIHQREEPFLQASPTGSCDANKQMQSAADADTLGSIHRSTATMRARWEEDPGPIKPDRTWSVFFVLDFTSQCNADSDSL